MIGGAGAVMYALATHAADRIVVVTSEYDSRNHINPLPPETARVLRVRRLSHILSWPPAGRLRALIQAAYDRCWVYPLATRDLVRILQSLQPKLVCIGTLWSCSWVVEAACKWRHDAKVLVYVHGEEVPASPHAGYFDQLRINALRKATHLVAVSSFTKAALVNIGVPQERISLITNGVDLSRFQPREKSQRIVDRYALAGRKVLMTLARLDERKGQDVLIRALPQIRAVIPNLVYLVVGEGDYGATLRRLVAELHLEDTVTFTGAVAEDELADFYATCDLYAMPNRTTENGDTEGFGLVFLEAGACAKAVIGGMAGGVPDAIVDRQTGLLVDGTSVEAVADSCIRLLGDEKLRIEMGAAGLAHARANTWAEKTRQFLDLCDTVVLD